MLSDLVRLSTEKVLQELLEVEQAETLDRERYERGAGNGGYRNGYEPGTLRTAEGVLHVEKPQIRGLDAPYRSKLWARLSTKSEVLEQMVTEMYVRGLSVRDIEDAMLAATGAFVLSNSAVSDVTQRLMDEYDAFRKRDLHGFDVAYLFLDAVYEPLRRHGCAMGVLCAWGICTDGSQVLLHLVTGNGERTETVLELLRDMTKRGLRVPMTITTDGAPGLSAAVDSVFAESLRIRCWFHKMQNLQNKVPPDAWPAFKAMVAEVRDASSVDRAREQADLLVARYRDDYPSACECLTTDLAASLNHLRVPPRHRQLVRTTNLVERTFVEERRRTKVIPHLSDEKSAVKLIFSVLIRVSDRWSKRQFSAFEQKLVIQMRDELLQPTREETQPSQSKRRSAARSA